MTTMIRMMIRGEVGLGLLVGTRAVSTDPLIIIAQHLYGGLEVL